MKHKNHSLDALLQSLNCGLVKTKHIINSNSPFLLLFHPSSYKYLVKDMGGSQGRSAHSLDISVIQIQISSLMSLHCPGQALLLLCPGQ